MVYVQPKPKNKKQHNRTMRCVKLISIQMRFQRHPSRLEHGFQPKIHQSKWIFLSAFKLTSGAAKKKGTLPQTRTPENGWFED